MSCDCEDDVRIAVDETVTTCECEITVNQSWWVANSAQISFTLPWGEYKDRVTITKNHKLEYTHNSEYYSILMTAIAPTAARFDVCYNYSSSAPKGKITNIDAPAELGEGDEIDVTAIMKNEGGTLGEFRFYLLDENGNTIDKEPDTYYKNIAAGASWTQKLTSNWKPWDMPDHDVVLKLDLRRQT